MPVPYAVPAYCRMTYLHLLLWRTINLTQSPFWSDELLAFMTNVLHNV